MSIFNMMYGKEGPGVPENEVTREGRELLWYAFRQNFWELIKLNLIFILSCIPIITIPAALKAMSKITFTMFLCKNFYVWEDYWAAFKENFLRSTLMGLGWILLLICALTSLRFYYNLSSVEGNAYVSVILLAMSLLILLGVVFMGFYLFPMEAKIDLPPKQIFKNAILLAILRLPWNLLTFFVTGLVGLALFLFLPLSILLILFFGFSFIHFITTFCAYTGIKKYVISQPEQSKTP